MQSLNAEHAHRVPEVIRVAMQAGGGGIDLELVGEASLKRQLARGQAEKMMRESGVRLVFIGGLVAELVEHARAVS